MYKSSKSVIADFPIQTSIDRRFFCSEPPMCHGDFHGFVMHPSSGMLRRPPSSHPDSHAPLQSVVVPALPRHGTAPSGHRNPGGTAWLGISCCFFCIWKWLLSRKSQLHQLQDVDIRIYIKIVWEPVFPDQNWWFEGNFATTALFPPDSQWKKVSGLICYRFFRR